MDLDLSLKPRTQGRAAVRIDAETIGQIVEADLARLETTRGVAAPALKRIRDSHHSLARVLASGATEADASRITGYSPSRISILKADPQFNELLEFYRGTAVEVVADFRERMASLGMEALEELRSRLEENPDDLSSSLLVELTKVLADRTGHAPKTHGATNVQVNVNLAERMERAKARVATITREAEDQ